MSKMKICFLTKKNKPTVKESIKFLKYYFKEVDVFFGKFGDKLPPQVINNEYDMIISYICPWIIPFSVLKNTKKWNINFHPGPPEYPGIGCFNFAIYDSAKEFGAVAHIMNPKVDSGKIIGVRRFKISRNESVFTLSQKTYKATYNLFKTIIKFIHLNNKLPVCNELWLRKAYKRKELEELSKIDFSMSKKEISKRIRATYLKGFPEPYIDIKGYKFTYNPNR